MALNLGLEYRISRQVTNYDHLSRGRKHRRMQIGQDRRKDFPKEGIVEINERNVGWNGVRTGVARDDFEVLTLQFVFASGQVFLSQADELRGDFDAEHTPKWVTCGENHCTPHSRSKVEKYMISR